MVVTTSSSCRGGLAWQSRQNGFSRRPLLYTLYCQRRIRRLLFAVYTAANLGKMAFWIDPSRHCMFHTTILRARVVKHERRMRRWHIPVKSN